MKKRSRIYWFLVFLFCLSGCSITRQRIKHAEKLYDKLNVIQKEYQLDSSVVYLRKVGTGNQKLLLFHGFGPVPQIQWEDLVEALHSDFTLYIPDLVYFGKSSSDFEEYDPRFQARQLFQVIKNEKIDHLLVGGVSYGGLIAEIFAHQYPEITDGLILIDALSIFTNRQYTDSLAEAHGYQDIGEVLIPDNGRALKTLFDLTFYDAMKYPAFVLNKPTRLLYSNQRDHKRNLLSYLFENEKNIKKWDLSYSGPVCIIWGKEDILIPVSTSYQLKNYYPHAELHIVPKAAHAINMENAEEIGEIVRKTKKPVK